MSKQWTSYKKYIMSIMIKRLIEKQTDLYGKCEITN